MAAFSADLVVASANPPISECVRGNLDRSGRLTRALATALKVVSRPVVQLVVSVAQARARPKGRASLSAAGVNSVLVYRPHWRWRLRLR